MKNPAGPDRRTDRRATALLALAAIVSAATVVRRGLSMPTGAGWLDVYVYLDASRQLLTDPHHIYAEAMAQLSQASALRAFIYPPAPLLLFLPLGGLAALLGTPAAALVWILLDTAALWAGIWLLTTALGATRFQRAVLLAAVVSASAAYSEVYSGQLNGLLVLLVAMAWRDQDTTRCGLWLGLAVAVKPVAPLLLLVPLLRRRWRVEAVALGVIAAAELIPTLVIGPGAVWDYAVHFLPHITTAAIADLNNMGPAHLLAMLAGGSPAASGDAAPITPLHLSTLAAVAGAVFRIAVLFAWLAACLRSQRWGVGILGALALSALIGETVWAHYFLLTAPLLCWAAITSRIGDRALFGWALLSGLLGVRLYTLTYPDLRADPGGYHLVLLAETVAWVLLVTALSCAALVLAARVGISRDRDEPGGSSRNARPMPGQSAPLQGV